MRAGPLVLYGFSFVLAFASACATGTLGSGDSTVSGDAGTSTKGGGGSDPYNNPGGGTDGGVKRAGNGDSGGGGTIGGGDDSGGGSTGDDAGSITFDSGGGGGGGGGGGAGDCTGTTIQDPSFSGETYDDACDAYYMNTGGANPCTPGGNDCDAVGASNGLTMCCFKPKSGSFCDQDYSGAPQCVPK